MARVLTLALAVLLLAGCELHAGPVDVVQGSGHVQRQSRDVRGFDQVVLSGLGTLTITQGSTESLTVEAEDNLLLRLRSDVGGSTLRLGPNDIAIRPTKITEGRPGSTP